MQLVDPLEAINLGWVIEVMRQTMMCIGHSDGAIGPVAAFTTDHQCNDSGHVGLECNSHQIKHEVDVLFEGWGNSPRAIDGGLHTAFQGLLLNILNAGFNFTD